MELLSTILVMMVMLLHVGFGVLEICFWTKPLGLKVFGQPLEKAKSSAVLAQNQGLYNLFLAAGLLWSLVHPNADFAKELQLFFLWCVVVAGVFGAKTVSRKILYVQAAPAFLAVITVFLK